MEPSVKETGKAGNGKAGKGKAENHLAQRNGRRKLKQAIEGNNWNRRRKTVSGGYESLLTYGLSGSDKA